MYIYIICRTSFKEDVISARVPVASPIDRQHSYILRVAAAKTDRQTNRTDSVTPVKRPQPQKQSMQHSRTAHNLNRRIV